MDFHIHLVDIENITYYTNTEQNDECNTFVFIPIFHDLNSKIEDIFYVHKRPISLFSNIVHKSVLVSISPLTR